MVSLGDISRHLTSDVPDVMSEGYPNQLLRFEAGWIGGCFRRLSEPRDLAGVSRHCVCRGVALLLGSEDCEVGVEPDKLFEEHLGLLFASR